MCHFIKIKCYDVRNNLAVWIFKFTWIRTSYKLVYKRIRLDDKIRLLSDEQKWIDLMEFFSQSSKFVYRPTVLTKNSMACSPQTNYTNRATAICRRSWCQLLLIESVTWTTQQIPTAVNLDFLDLQRYFSNQVAPQLYSRGWVDLVPNPLLLRKSGSAGNRTLTSRPQRRTPNSTE
jgi:hypothetical protein